MDLNGDGVQDVISGSWPGELFFFAGRKEGGFAAPEMLKDKSGAYINIGGGFEETADGITITGHAEFVEEGEDTFAVYHGKRFKNTPEKPIAITGTASVVHAADLDGDGDFDLVLGDIYGNVHLVPNEGTKTAWSFGAHQALLADGAAIKVEGDAGPVVADWDGDGKADLLVGAGDGSVTFFRNVGDPKRPSYAKGRVLVPGTSVEYSEEAPKTPQRGIRAKIAVDDWNGDGRPDLLLGDFTNMSPDRTDATPETREREARLKAELEELRDRFASVADRMQGPDRLKDKDEIRKARDEMKDLVARMEKLQEQVPQDYSSHGFVWLFLRTPAR